MIPADALPLTEPCLPLVVPAGPTLTGSGSLQLTHRAHDRGTLLAPVGVALHVPSCATLARFARHLVVAPSAAYIGPCIPRDRQAPRLTPS